ncbi:polysaccharide deacetylase family protein [Aestuariivirga sp.]|uniref:polysaccharide deacetylase family protein n=1 Tax=Aestuariivirga sp. TaxID=2650926 RepID=UPI0039E5BF37
MSETTVCINIDDIGMCHGANVAFVALSKAGRVDSGSLMVPCPWYLEMVDLAKANPDLNVGIHLTLNSEKTYYRWRPMSKASKASGLVDGDGFMWRNVPELRRNAHPNAVEEELRTQIEAFKASGLKATHMDGHMGAILAPEFYDIYLRLAEEYGIPSLYPASMESYGPKHNLGPLDDTFYTTRAAVLRSKGKTPAARVLETPWHLRGTVEQRYTELFSQTAEGFNFYALHANAPGEIEVIEDSAQVRIQEFDFLASATFGQWLEKQAFRRTCIPA